MNIRHKGRLLAIQALYAWEIKRCPVEDVINFDWEDSMHATVQTFAQLLVAGTLEKIESIDSMIQRHLEHWTFSRLNKIDLAILRVGTYELLYQTDNKASIVISEAISLAVDFGTEESFRFVNGVLDSIRKTTIVEQL
ncbi:MAG: transcription antitermination factor NusB [Treponema sp.]|jgi:N utilization substance protein B|nr:transcription antitermination factor NusB [Treponema sp.]